VLLESLLTEALSVFPHVGEQSAEQADEVGVKTFVEGAGAGHLLQEALGVVRNDRRCGNKSE
jgi:hypothetical protein